MCAYKCDDRKDHAKSKGLLRSCHPTSRAFWEDGIYYIISSIPSTHTLSTEAALCEEREESLHPLVEPSLYVNNAKPGFGMFPRLAQIFEKHMGPSPLAPKSLAPQASFSPRQRRGPHRLALPCNLELAFLDH